MSTRINMQTSSFDSIAKYYKQFCASTDVFQKEVAHVIEGASGKLSENPVNTCALRLSYALHRAGVKLPRIKRSYRYIGKYRSPAYFPSLSIDFKWLLNGEKKISRNKRRMLKGKKGIILFHAGKNHDSFGARGHVTMFDGIRCLDHGDAYWHEQAITSVWYWEL